MNEAQDNLTAAIDGQRGTMQRFLDAQAGITNNSNTAGTEESTETTTTARRGGYRSMKKKRNKYGK